MLADGRTSGHACGFYTLGQSNHAPRRQSIDAERNTQTLRIGVSVRKFGPVPALPFVIQTPQAHDQDRAARLDD